MTTDPAYRLYLEEKFKGLNSSINAQFITVHDKLDAIEKQTTKTNGRVTELEGQVLKVEKDILTHPINCNKGKDIEEIKRFVAGDKLLKSEARKRFENILKVIGVIIAIGALGTSTYFGFRNTQQGATIIQKQDDQSVPVVVNPRGEILMLPDSSRILFFNNDSARYLIKRER
jgi:hypothetical protein